MTHLNRTETESSHTSSRPVRSVSPAFTTARHFVSSVLFLVIAQILSWTGAATLTVLSPRYLGDVDLGKYSFALALTSLIGLTAGLGIDTYVTKAVARDPRLAGEMIWVALAVRVPIGVVIAVLTILAATYLSRDGVTTRLIYVFGGCIVLTALDMATSTLQGLHRMRAIAAARGGTALVFAGLAAWVLVRGGGPVEVAMTWAISLGVGLAITYGAIVRQLRWPGSVNLHACLSVVRSGLPFFIWAAALVVYGQIDTVLLTFLSGSRVVGWYVAAYRIVSLPAFIPTIVITVLFPVLSATASSVDAFARVAREAMRFVALASVPMGLGIMLLPDRIMGFFQYPSTFEHAIVPIVIMAPHIPLAGLDMVIGTALNSRDRQKAWAVTAVAAAGLNPALNLAAIPIAQHVFGNGAIGAAAVTTATELFMMVVGLCLLPPQVFTRADLMGVLKIVAAGLVMAVAVWFVRDLSLILIIAIGAAVYVTGCVVSRQLTPSDLTTVRDQLVTRLSQAR